MSQQQLSIFLFYQHTLKQPLQVKNGFRMSDTSKSLVIIAAEVFCRLDVRHIMQLE